MAVQIDTEFLQNRAAIVINCSTIESLTLIVNYLLRCDDPDNTSKPGEHYHFFVVHAKEKQIHLSKTGANCIRHYMRNRVPTESIPNLSNPNSPYDAEGELKPGRTEED